MIDLTCKNCGVVFQRRDFVVKHGRGVYCSRECMYAPRKRIETKCKNCGATFTALKSHVDAGRHQFCDRRCMSEFFSREYRGEKTSNWRGGVTSESQAARHSAKYREWREAVFARDNWTCQDCGRRNGDHAVHHVFSFSDFPEHRFDAWNGVTLCVRCHQKVHGKVRQ